MLIFSSLTRRQPHPAVSARCALHLVSPGPRRKKPPLSLSRLSRARWTSSPPALCGSPDTIYRRGRETVYTPRGGLNECVSCCERRPVSPAASASHALSPSLTLCLSRSLCFSVCVSLPLVYALSAPCSAAAAHEQRQGMRMHDENTHSGSCTRHASIPKS